MNDHRLPELHIGHLTATIPVIQGGMGVGVSLAGLASAVSSEGGIGVIASAGIGMLEPDFDRNFKEANSRAMKREILSAKAQTRGPVGVNIMVALSDHESLVMASIEAGADLILMGAGLPLKIPHLVTPERLLEGKICIVPIVSSARAADLISRTWLKSGCLPDGFVVEGPMAGGHLGFKKEQIEHPDYRLENLVTETISILEPYRQSSGKELPVIAAGGIFTGEDIHRFLSLGAKGVQMATRFVTTFECDAHMRFKQAYLNASDEDLIIIDSPVGLPGRAIRNVFLDDVSAGINKPFSCPWKCLRTCNFKEAPYCIGKALVEARLGNLEDGFVFAGSNAWRTDRIVTVRELMKTIVLEYQEAEMAVMTQA